MCGRFTLRTLPAAWGQLLLPGWDDAEIARRADELKFAPRFNIAPTQLISTVLQDVVGGTRTWEMWRWGLIPPWSNDVSIGARMINARSETLDSKRSFKAAFRAQRCLIPCDGYFEWAKVDGGKQPYLIEPCDGQPLAMAGLWEKNKRLGSDGEPLFSVTVITTAANETTRSVHDRMPVFLPAATHQQWLDPGFADTDALKKILQPAENWLLKLVPVAKTVGNVRIDDERCVERVESETDPPQPSQGFLFGESFD